MNLPYRNATKLDISQGYSEAHKAIDFAPYQGYGKFLCCPENVKITNIIDSPELSESLDPLKRGYGVVMQSMANPKLYHLYWHCLPSFPVSIGDYVNAGQIVAQMGNSGDCHRLGVDVPFEERTTTKAGTHLHWETFLEKNGVRIYINPLLFNLKDQPNYSILDQISAIIKILKKLKVATK